MITTKGASFYKHGLPSAYYRGTNGTCIMHKKIRFKYEDEARMQLNCDLSFSTNQRKSKKIMRLASFKKSEIRNNLATNLVDLLHKNILLKFIIVTWHNSLSNTFFLWKTQKYVSAGLSEMQLVVVENSCKWLQKPNN